jgi:hypothetical protein
MTLKKLAFLVSVFVFTVFGNTAFLSVSGVQNLKGYTINSVQATIDFKPDTLNLQSGGKYVTVYIEVQGYDVEDIDISSIRLNNIVSPTGLTSIGDYDNDGIEDLMVKFDRAEVQSILSVGIQIVAITGSISGMPLYGADTVNVIEQNNNA